VQDHAGAPLLEQGGHFPDLLRVLCCDVPGFADVFGQIVEFPGVWRGSLATGLELNDLPVAPAQGRIDPVASLVGSPGEPLVRLPLLLAGQKRQQVLEQNVPSLASRSRFGVRMSFTPVVPMSA